MPVADGNPPQICSWITPKADKGGASVIEGRGVHAIQAIAEGEVVAVKGGHIVDSSVVAALPEAIRNSASRSRLIIFLRRSLGMNTKA